MTADSVEPLIAEAVGPAALPRKNGELVFDAPWESRAFAIAVLLSGEVYEWEEFRGELIARIADWEAEADRDDEDWSYYDRWLLGLEHLLVERGVLRPDELSERIAEVAHLAAHEHDGPHQH
ncbi:MAG: nitrile hydratase accessory protein [Actinobacteria bacterium]|nr:nitrile hydratase accessory protein [Actinomycetota bacterium]